MKNSRESRSLYPSVRSVTGSTGNQGCYEWLSSIFREESFWSSVLTLIFDPLLYTLVSLDCCLWSDVGLGGGGRWGLSRPCDTGRLVGLGGAGGRLLSSVPEDLLRRGASLGSEGGCTPMESRMLVAGPARPAWAFMDSSMFFTMFMSMFTGSKSSSSSAIDFFLFVLDSFYK